MSVARATKKGRIIRKHPLISDVVLAEEWWNNASLLERDRMGALYMEWCPLKYMKRCVAVKEKRDKEAA
jgi:hypothetical protein